jgi:hypothetical protein
VGLEYCNWPNRSLSSRMKVRRQLAVWGLLAICASACAETLPGLGNISPEASLYPHPGFRRISPWRCRRSPIQKPRLILSPLRRAMLPINGQAGFSGAGSNATRRRALWQAAPHRDKRRGLRLVDRAMVRTSSKSARSPSEDIDSASGQPLSTQAGAAADVQF